MLPAKVKNQAAPTFERHANGSPNDSQRRDHSAVDEIAQILLPRPIAYLRRLEQDFARKTWKTKSSRKPWSTPQKKVDCALAHVARGRPVNAAAQGASPAPVRTHA